MAECVDSLRFLLLLFSILPLSHEVKVQNVRDVAPQKKGTLASSVQGWDNVSSSIDGNNNTCVRTDNEMKPWWALDLGENNNYTIVGLHINYGSNQLSHIEIWVGPKPGQSAGNNFCSRHLPSGSKNSSIDIACVHPIRGRYVTISVLERTYLGLCEVKIYECLEGFFGNNCSKECHCAEGPSACPRINGQCECAAGWSGASCQTQCEDGFFGENCLSRCHCAGGETCNRTTGDCPTDECEKNWNGPTCQTELPNMSDQLYRPIAVEKTSRSITLEWRAWEKYVDPESTLMYYIEFKPYRIRRLSTYEPDWLRTRMHIMATGERYQRTTVSDLTTNTNYVFRVVPYIHERGEAPVQGRPTPDGGPYKTRCTDPDPPTIRHIEPMVDKTTDPPKPFFNVKWQDATTRATTGLTQTTTVTTASLAGSSDPIPTTTGITANTTDELITAFDRAINTPLVAQYTSNNALMTSHQPMPRQAYYADILPEAVETWRLFRSALQKEHQASLRASFTRYLARSGRFPDWASGTLPPVGLITTPLAALQVVNIRREQARNTMNLVASLLENKAASHHIAVDTNSDGLKKLYERHAAAPGATHYKLSVAVTLAHKLVERETATLNSRLNRESTELKFGPEVSLWKGIPHNLIPPNIPGVSGSQVRHNQLRANQSQGCQVFPSALFLDEDGPPTDPRSNTAAPQPNQVVSAPWGTPPGRRPTTATAPSRRQNQGRRGPYGETSARPQQTSNGRPNRRREDRRQNRQDWNRNQPQGDLPILSNQERNLLQRLLGRDQNRT